MNYLFYGDRSCSCVFNTEFSLMKNLTFRLLRTYAEARSVVATCSTNFPRVWPATPRSKASLALASGIVSAMTGRIAPEGSGANLIIMDNPRHDPTLFREARTLQRPSFQPSSYHSGRAMVCHLQAELSRRVRSDGGARRHGRTYHRFAMGPMFRSRFREKMEELRVHCRFILESR